MVKSAVATPRVQSAKTLSVVPVPAFAAKPVNVVIFFPSIVLRRKREKEMALNANGPSVLDVFAMMGAGVPPNVALFNKDRLGVKFPVLLKFGSSVSEVAQDLLVTVSVS